jgi:cell division control protein 45
MSVHRAIIRTGTSIIDKQEIKTMRNRKVVILNQGPDLALFVHHGMLTRLALWLIDALRDRMPVVKNGSRSRKDLPMVLACLNEPQNRFTVVGVTAAPDFGEVYRKYVLIRHPYILLMLTLPPVISPLHFIKQLTNVVLTPDSGPLMQA